MRLPTLAATFFVAIANAQPTTAITVGAYTDDTSGVSYDLSAHFTPVENWAFDIGAGHSQSSAERGDLGGTAWHTAVNWQRSRLGVNLAAGGWHDSQQFVSGTRSLELTWFATESLSVAAILEHRSFDVRYEASTSGVIRPARSSIDFSATGVGAELAWTGAGWGASLRGQSYHYDTKLTRVLAVSRATTTRSFPRLEALADSVLTRTAGALDRTLSASIERNFARSGLHADYTRSRDVISEQNLDSVSLSYRYNWSPRLELEATFGRSRSAAFSASNFGGLALTLRR